VGGTSGGNLHHHCHHGCGVHGAHDGEWHSVASDLSESFRTCSLSSLLVIDSRVASPRQFGLAEQRRRKKKNYPPAVARAVRSGRCWLRALLVLC
jgi:hypothetical protein